MKEINKRIQCFLLAIGTCFSASAQKLPAVQKVGFKAPVNIKIDGATAEWNNKFQAFNHSIDAFYTMANDDNNLYLVVQAKDKFVVKKIIGGGIVLSITPAKNKFEQGWGVGPRITEAGRLNINSYYTRFNEYTGKKAKTKQTDSLLSILNRELNNGSKEIIVSGIKGIDNIISIYNSYGIKSAMLFDQTGALNWELVIPLKYVKNITDQPGFFYNLMVRGMAFNAKIVKSKTGESAAVTNVPMNMITGRASDTEQLMNNTDFWAEYKLAK